ncbi:MAG: hypothetical protein OEM38_05930, partial [Gammaproteobacteria bacterium]|nr:hypothetical protein [Gammaproteobacteria bacterium]
MQCYPKFIFYVMVIVSVLLSSTAFSVTLPDAATPGGALPRSLENRTSIADDSDRLVIPRVIDRPLGVDKGARVKVREFVLKGVESHIKYNIRKEDVAFIAEANRVKRQRLDEADMEGFTPEEVDDIAEFIRQLVEEPNQRPTSANLWKLVFKLRKSEWNRGLTMGQIQEVADEITRYYRQQGMILATAFVPAQDIVDGKVIIQVLEGKLGEVTVEGNKMYSDGLIRRPFKALKGKPVVKDSIETGLLYITDYPGLSVNGIFRPGKSLGETDLLVKVIDERRFNGGVSLDNNGSEFTGEIRSRLDLTVNNITGNADQLSLAVLKSFQPTNGTFGNIAYSLPVMRSDWIIGANLAYNEFTVNDFAGAGTSDVTGESTIGGGFIKKIFQRNRGLNSYALADLSRKKSESKLTDSEIDTDEYDTGRLEFGFDAIDTRFGGINLAILQYHHGIGTRLGAVGFHDSALEGGFQKINFNFSRLQTLKRNFSLLITTQFQYSDVRLNSLEQLPLGGADSVRAYPISEYLRDVGYFGSFEFILNAPGFADKPAFAGRRWGEILSFSVFYDVGGGWLRNAEKAETRKVDLQGAGAGIKLNLPGKFNVRLQAAKRVGSEKPLN